MPFSGGWTGDYATVSVRIRHVGQHVNIVVLLERMPLKICFFF